MSALILRVGGSNYTKCGIHIVQALVLRAPKVCIRFPTCCSVSEPDLLKGQISHFTSPLKIRGAVGEMSESMLMPI